MTAYLISTDPELVFAAPGRTADQLQSDVTSWAREGRMMTVAGDDPAGDEATVVIAWDDVTDYTISETEPSGNAIVLHEVGED